MDVQISSIQNLISVISKLPCLGPKSAKKIAIHLLKSRETEAVRLMNSIESMIAETKICSICYNLDNSSPCHICRDIEHRSKSTICVVEEVSDLWVMEKIGVYKGGYHVLGGTLSLVNNNGPKELHVEELLDRILHDKVNEVIMATNANVGGQNTAFYLQERIENDIVKKHGCEVKISILAKGIPMGAEIDYLDEGTLTAAFLARSGF